MKRTSKDPTPPTPTNSSPDEPTIILPSMTELEEAKALWRKQYEQWKKPEEPPWEEIEASYLDHMRQYYEQVEEEEKAGLIDRRIAMDRYRRFRQGLSGEEVGNEISGIVTGETLGHWLKRKQSSKSHLLKGWLARGAVTAWVAMTGAAKTVMAHRLAWNLAQGLPFLGIYPPGPLNVLYVDLETPEFMKDDLFDAMPPSQAPRLHHIYHDIQAARRELQTPGYDLTVIDNLQSNRTFTTDERDNVTAHEEASRFKALARTMNRAALLLYNTGKKSYRSESEDGTLEQWLTTPYKARGASELEDRVDEVLNMYPLIGKGPESQKQMFTHIGIAKGRLGSKSNYYKVRWLDGYDYEVAEKKNMLGNRQEQLAASALEHIPAGEERDFATLREALGIEPQSPDDKAMRRGLNDLTADSPGQVNPAKPLILVAAGRVCRKV